MTDLAGWKVRGPVRTLRTEFAEWDPADATWQARRRISAVVFRPDGQISESETRNQDGSVARSARLYDAGGWLIETQTWMDDGPRSPVLRRHGNWTERVVSSRAGSQAEVRRSNVERRTIAYYEP